MQKKSNKASDIEILDALPVCVNLLLLKDKFSHYKNSRKKIFDITKKGYLHPIKRGHYLNLKSAGFKTVQVESLANTIYFPSYVSAEWALQYYGLLMDRVHKVTSVTTRRSAEFQTPIGVFSFEHINKHRYPHGYVMQTTGDATFLMASPEKALIDYVSLRIGEVSWKTKADIATFLLEDLRIHVKVLLTLVKNETLREMLPHYHRNAKETRILKWLVSARERSHGESD